VVVLFQVLFTKQSLKDLERIKAANLTEKVKSLVSVLKENPYQNPPEYEKLVGSLSGYYSRRINVKQRMVYSVNDSTKVVKILRLWSHYE